MHSLRLLGGASCLAIVVCTGAVEARDLLESTPLAVTAIGGEDLEFYGGAGVSGLTAGLIIPEVNAGIKIRGIGSPRTSLSLDGSLALQQPGSVGELWVGSRLGFTVDDISRIEVVGSGSVGLIGGTPAYRLGLGAEIPVLPQTGLVIEGIGRGNFGAAPTDFGLRGGVHYYPGRADEIEILRGPQGTLFGSSNTTFYLGGSVTAVPSAGAFVPAFDFGGRVGLGGGFDIGARGSMGWQLPASNYEIWGGLEGGFQVTPQVRPYLFGDLGSIGGFPVNRFGAGLEFQVDPSLSLTTELGGRGGIGTITEFTAKAGLRYNINDLLYPSGPDFPASSGVSSVDPYIGKSLSALNTGDFIPAVDLGVNFHTGTGLVPGVRAQVGYQLPAGTIEAWAGGQLGFSATPQFTPYVFGDIGSIGGFNANRIGVGAEFNVNDMWGIKGEVFGRGGIGTITEGGVKVGATFHLGDWLQDQAALDLRY